MFCCQTKKKRVVSISKSMFMSISPIGPSMTRMMLRFFFLLGRMIDGSSRGKGGQSTTEKESEAFKCTARSEIAEIRGIKGERREENVPTVRTHSQPAWRVYMRRCGSYDRMTIR
jgi:hypothetical protein